MTQISTICLSQRSSNTKFPLSCILSVLFIWYRVRSTTTPDSLFESSLVLFLNPLPTLKPISWFLPEWVFHREPILRLLPLHFRPPCPEVCLFSLTFPGFRLRSDHTSLLSSPVHCPRTVSFLFLLYTPSTPISKLTHKPWASIRPRPRVLTVQGCTKQSEWDRQTTRLCLHPVPVFVAPVKPSVPRY